MIIPLIKVWSIEYIIPNTYKNGAEEATEAVNSIIQEMKDWEEDGDDNEYREDDNEEFKENEKQISNKNNTIPQNNLEENIKTKEKKSNIINQKIIKKNNKIEKKSLGENILNIENSQKLLELVDKKLDKLEKASQLRQELKKQAKNIRKNTDKLIKDTLENKEDILDKTKTIKGLRTLVDVTNKIFSAYTIYQDSKTIKTKAKILGVEISTGVAQIASLTQNSLGNLLEDNPYDAVVSSVGDILETAGEILNINSLKKSGNFLKDKLTIGGNFKETINLAVTTSEETFKRMEKEYDNLYKEETKNAGVFKKAYKYIKYKIIGKGYYYTVKGTSSVIKTAGKIWDKVKSWF